MCLKLGRSTWSIFLVIVVEMFAAAAYPPNPYMAIRNRRLRAVAIPKR